MRLTQMVPAVVMFSMMLGGCSLLGFGAKEVTITPQISFVDTTPLKLSGPITVTVYNERSLSNLDKEPSLVMGDRYLGIANDLAASVKTAVEKVLAQSGMQPTHSSVAPQLQIYIDRLGYDIPEDRKTDRVDAHVALRIALRSSNKTFHHRVSVTRSDLVLPVLYDGEQGGQLINATLNEALQKTFADPGFRSALAAL